MHTLSILQLHRSVIVKEQHTIYIREEQGPLTISCCFSTEQGLHTMSYFPAVIGPFSHAGNQVVNEWQLEGVVAPHDLTISAAPVRITGAGERVLAFYVAETRSASSLLRKFILLHRGGLYT